MKSDARENIISTLKLRNDNKGVEIDVTVSSNHGISQNQRSPQQAEDATFSGPIISHPVNCDGGTYAIVRDFKIARKLLRRRHIMKERREKREALEHAERERKRCKSGVTGMSKKLISGIHVVEDSSVEDQTSSHDDEQMSLSSFEDRKI